MMDNHMFTAAGTLIAQETPDGEVTVRPWLNQAHGQEDATPTPEASEAETPTPTPTPDAEAETPTEATAEETLALAEERLAHAEEKLANLQVASTGMAEMIDVRNRTITSLEDTVRRQRETHAAFRRRVVKAALEIREDQGWCWPGFYEAMQDLDLGTDDGVPSRERQVEIHSFTVTVEADEDGDVYQSAVDAAALDHIRNNLSSSGWEVID